MNHESGAEGSGDERGGLLPLDFVLGEGTHDERELLRQQIADDPRQALDVAEAVTLFEACRQLRVEPSAQLGCRLYDVMRRAERRVGRPAPARWSVTAACVATASAMVFFVLSLWDPLGRRAPSERFAHADQLNVPAPPAADHAVVVDSPVVVREATDLAWAATVEAVRRRLELESSPRLREAFELALRSEDDRLARWLDSRNALALLRVEHELRSKPEVRAALLRRQGGMVAVDSRVQELADLVTSTLPVRLAAGGGDIDDVALAVRALIAAGPASTARERALLDGAAWLAARLPECSGVGLATTLGPLVEVAAVYGRYLDQVQSHGERFVAEVLHADRDTWGRWRPELLGGSVTAATVADASRVLALLPGLGVDADRCLIVRRLLLGRLQERRDLGEDGPEVPVAMVFGFADLLEERERDEVEGQLRRWNPMLLVPDFTTVYQLAAGLQPGRLGHTRLRREMRRLAVLPDPSELAARAAFCLCLATNYESWPVNPSHSPAADD